MKVLYLGISDPLELINGKVYDVVSVEDDWYRIVDETEEDCLYPPQYFEVISWIKTSESDDGSSAWISSDPNFIGDVWLEATEDASKRCPACGSPITYRSRTDCLGYFCAKCDYSVITQPSYPMEDDFETSIWDDFKGGDTLGSEGSKGGRIVYNVEYHPYKVE